MNEKKVLVSGCYDLLHAGHVAFFKEAAAHGRLFVSIGTDENLRRLKGKAPYFTQQERLFLVQSIRTVQEAFVASGSGMLDFEPDMRRIKPDCLVVNSDGHTPEKEALCKSLGVEYVVLRRIPEPGLPARASSDAKKELRFPYRLCLAGGWIDQPWVSEIHPGSVTVAQIWPTQDFNDRSGLATSSRRVGIELWGDREPEGDPVRNAHLLFGAENPPGTRYVSGSQDHIGLLVPGVSRLHYAGGYWPDRIDSHAGKDACEWLSRVLRLVPLEPRPQGYDPLKSKILEKECVKALGEAGDLCYESILGRDVNGLGEAMSMTLQMWRKMLPFAVPDWVMETWESYRHYPGACASGCGGGYMMIASEEPVEGAIQVKVKY